MPESLRFALTVLGILLIPILLVLAAWMFGRTLENPDSAEARRNRRIGWVVWLFWVVLHGLRTTDGWGFGDLAYALWPALTLVLEQVVAAWRRRKGVPPRDGERTDAPVVGGVLGLALLPVALVAAPAAALPVTAPTFHAAGPGPAGLVMVDVDGDGVLDIAVVNPSIDAWSLLAGDGDGSFQAPAAVATGDEPVGLIAGDFNSDGDADLVTADHLGNTASVHFGAPGATFQPRVAYPVNAGPVLITLTPGFWGVSPGLVTVSADGQTSQYESDGQANFFWYTTGHAGAAPGGVAALDFDGDGRADIVVANPVGTPRVTLLSAQYEYYDRYYYYVTTTLAAPPEPHGVVTVDLDGSSWPDLVAAMSDGATGGIAVWQGDGQTPYTTRTDIDAGVPLTRVVAADLDGDEDPDIVATGPTGAVALFLNDGADLYLEQVHDLGEPIAGAAVGDVENDGFADIALALPSSDRVAILHGGSTAQVPAGPADAGALRLLVDVNPVRDTARFRLAGPAASDDAIRLGATVDITDIVGRHVRRLSFDASGGTTSWDLRDAAGARVVPGLYLAIAVSGPHRTIARVTVLR
jgi:hypothetical protein